MSNTFEKIANKEILLRNVSDKELADFCIYANNLYRDGNPIISDSDYDFIFLAELQKRQPNHPFLQRLEQETTSFGDKLLLPKPMLSTDKAYSFAEIEKFCERLIKSANEIHLSIDEIILKSTPKLDGFAAFDDGKTLYTRGDGKKGSDVSRVFERGLQVYENNSRGLGAGEIVVSKSYFDKYLADDFEHPRNFTASIIKEKELDDKTKLVIDSGGAFFVPFSTLPSLEFTIEKLLKSFDEIISTALKSVDFDVDGVVIEATNPELKEVMGSNRKFHRWMIAFKENKESKQVKVLKVQPQVGRTGKITPVAILESVVLSGATITHATCHHYGMVKNEHIGEGSIVELVRSGQVIPKITKVLQPSKATIPTHCPSCESKLSWQSDFLMCLNHNNCPAQVVLRLEHFFKTLDNNDGFGTQTIKKLYNFGITTISQIYSLTLNDFTNFGFGDKTSENLISELQNSQTIQIEDYRFLSAFGVERLGLGNSENLLKNYNLQEIFDLSAEHIAGIDGFAQITAIAIVSGLKNIKSEFDAIYNLGFSLEKTIISQNSDNFFAGKKLVFTGSMQHPREQMQKDAKSVGAIIQKAVSGKTDYLIIGEKVGKSKLEKAQKLQVEIIDEHKYLELKQG